MVIYVRAEIYIVCDSKKGHQIFEVKIATIAYFTNFLTVVCIFRGLVKLRPQSADF